MASKDAPLTAVVSPGRRQLVGALFVLSAAMLFGISIVMARALGAASYPVSTILVIRFTVGAVLLAGMARAIHQRLRPAPGELRWLLASSLLGYMAATHLLYSALQYGTAPAVTFLGFTYPVFVAILWVSVTRALPGPLVSTSLVLAGGGVALIAASAGELAIQPVGIALALASAVATAAYFVMAAAKIRGTPPLSSAFWMSASAAVALLLGIATSHDRTPSSDLKQLLLVLGIAVCGSAALVLLLSGIPRIGPVRASVIAAVEPLCVALLAPFFLDERLTPTAGIGGMLILVGATCATAAKQRVSAGGASS